MNSSNARMLLIAGLAVVGLLIAVVGVVWLVWGWPPSFTVTSVEIK